MPNTEDYLDGLLDSITKAKSDAGRTERRDKSKREADVRRRNRISPDDDFMEMNGLYEESSRRQSRRRRRNHIDDDFLDEFDREMSDDDEDDFIRAFERELAGEDGGDSFEITDIAKDADSIEVARPKEPASEKTGADAVLGDIAGIVSEAKAKIEETVDPLLDTISAKMEEPAQESFTAGMESTAGKAEEEQSNASSAEKEESILPEEFAEDELDLSVASPVGDGEEPPLMDEDGDDMDLMDMLSQDGEEDLVDIGELLSSDEEGEELTESRESFEEGAKSVETGGGGTETQEAASGSAEEDAKKPGLLARILAIFKKGDEEEESAVGVVDPTIEQLAAESEEIAEEGGESEESPAEAKARKKKEKDEEKAKKKAEKDAAKKAKDAEKKAAADKKAADKAAKAAAKAAKAKKKKKKKDTSPKIPLYAIIPFLLLGASVIVGVNIVSGVLGYQGAVRSATNSFEKEDYIEAYGKIAGVDLNPEDEQLRDQAKILAFLQTKYKEYQVCMNLEKYQMALDCLVDATYFYTRNGEKAEDLEVTEQYDALGALILNQLSTEFNMSEADAIELYKSMTRREYTTGIRNYVNAAGLKDDY